MAYKAAKKLIESGNFDAVDMTKKLDIFMLCGRITAEQYQELINLMAEKQ